MRRLGCFYTYPKLFRTYPEPLLANGGYNSIGGFVLQLTILLASALYFTPGLGGGGCDHSASAFAGIGGVKAVASLESRDDSSVYIAQVSYSSDDLRPSSLGNYPGFASARADMLIRVMGAALANARFA